MTTPPWTVRAESEEAVVREMARCLRELGEGRAPRKQSRQHKSRGTRGRMTRLSACFVRESVRRERQRTLEGSLVVHVPAAVAAMAAGSCR